MNTSRMTAVIAAAAVLAATGAAAHHSFAHFDRENEIVRTGTVARWAFNNPHSYLYMNIADENGEETLWSFEASAPTTLITRGITGSTFEPGDTLTFMYCPLRDGRPGGAIGWVRLGDGTFVNPSEAGCWVRDDTIERWKGWLEQGITSSAEAAERGQ